MRASAIVAILLSAAVFAAPIQEMDQSDASQDLAEIPEFSNYAEFAQWVETADLENMGEFSIGKIFKKGFKLLKKAGSSILRNGPQILDTITTVAGGGGAPAAPAGAEAAADPAAAAGAAN